MLLNHTYWDGLTIERYTSKRGRPIRQRKRLQPTICGPDKPLREAIKMLEYERAQRDENNG